MTWEILLQHATEKMRAAGIDSPRREARLLLAHALRGRPEDILSARLPPVSAEVRERFEIAVARRTAREPFAYIVGSREFWSLDFAVAPGVLIPRPETETLIEEALRRFPTPEAALRVLDLGTGSGCLLLAFLSERPRAFGVGVDISEIAAATARRNAKSLGLADRAKFIRGDWANAIHGAFDTIFINPPYIATDELARLETEVARYEPRTALDGGKDGLLGYRRIVAFLDVYLATDGMAFLELGQGQGKPIEKLIGEAKLSMDGTVCDLAGIPRCMVVRAGRQRDTSKKQLAIETRSG